MTVDFTRLNDINFQAYKIGIMKGFGKLNKTYKINVGFIGFNQTGQVLNDPIVFQLSNQKINSQYADSNIQLMENSCS